MAERKTCPLCRTPIVRLFRYGRIINKTNVDLMEKAFHLVFEVRKNALNDQFENILREQKPRDQPTSTRFYHLQNVIVTRKKVNDIAIQFLKLAKSCSESVFMIYAFCESIRLKDSSFYELQKNESNGIGSRTRRRNDRRTKPCGFGFLVGAPTWYDTSLLVRSSSLLLYILIMFQGVCGLWKMHDPMDSIAKSCHSAHNSKTKFLWQSLCWRSPLFSFHEFLNCF